MPTKGRKTAPPRVADTVRRDLHFPKTLDEQIESISQARGYSVQTVYTYAAERFINAEPMMELGRKVFELQEAMALNLKAVLEAQLKFSKDLDELKAEFRKYNQVNDGC